MNVRITTRKGVLDMIKVWSNPEPREYELKMLLKSLLKTSATLTLSICNKRVLVVTKKEDQKLLQYPKPMLISKLANRNPKLV